MNFHEFNAQKKIKFHHHQHHHLSFIIFLLPALCFSFFFSLTSLNITDVEKKAYIVNSIIIIIYLLKRKMYLNFFCKLTWIVINSSSWFVLDLLNSWYSLQVLSSCRTFHLYTYQLFSFRFSC